MQRCSGPEDWGEGRGPTKVGGDRGASGSWEASSGAGRGPEGCAGNTGPRQRQAALPRVPCSSCPGGRRSPRAVAGRGVQGALWPSGAGGRSGHGDAGGFTEDPRLQHLGCPAAALRPRPGSAALLRDLRGCGGPGARCGSAGAGPQQQRQPQLLQEWEASRRRLGPGRCPPEEAVCSGTTPTAMLRWRRPLLEVSVARRAGVPYSLAFGRPGGSWASPRARRTGRPAAAAASPTPRLGGGPQPFFLASPGRPEARGGRLGPASPGSPRPGLGSGAAGCVERGTGRVAGTLRVGPGAGPSAASYPGPCTYIPEGGRGRLFANSLGFSAPHAESRRVPGGGAGGQGERERERRKCGALKALGTPGVSFTHLTGLKTTVCVLFEVKFHHLPVAHLCLLLLHFASKRGLPWRKPPPSFAMLSFLDKYNQKNILKKENKRAKVWTPAPP